MLRSSRGQLYAWETGLAVPDPPTLRKLARVTGVADLAAAWAQWRDLRPSTGGSVDQRGTVAAAASSAPAHRAEAGREGRPPASHAGAGHAPRATLELLRSKTVDQNAERVRRTLCAWDALPPLVGETLRRSRTLGVECALVLFEVADRRGAQTDVGTAEQHVVWQYLADMIGQTLQAADSYFYDDTGRFVVLLSRASASRARDYARQTAAALAGDSLAPEALGVDRLTVRTTCVAYPADGDTAQTLLERLDALIAAAVGKIDAYGAHPEMDPR